MADRATSEVDVCNMALSYLGQKLIVSISPPTTALEQMCALWYVNVRQEVLRKYAIWNFCKVQTNIPIVSTTVIGGSPNPANITGITVANPAVVTAPSHGFMTGQEIAITGVVGMTQGGNKLNSTTAAGNYYTVNVIDLNTFTLTSVLSGLVINTIGWTNYTSGGVCTAIVTPALNPLIPSDYANAYQLPGDIIRFLSCGGEVETQQLKPWQYDIRNGLLWANNWFGNDDTSWDPSVNNSGSSSTAPPDSGIYPYGPDNWQNIGPAPLQSPNVLTIRYIKDVADITLWDSEAIKVFALELARELCMPVTKDPKILAMINGLLEVEIAHASSVDGQERAPLRIERSRIIEARQSGALSNPTYYFPRDYGF